MLDRSYQENPTRDAHGGEDPRIPYAESYLRGGWKIFVLGHEKYPLRRCDYCIREHKTPAQYEACICLVCHACYAATDDVERVGRMLYVSPRGLLAVRTGAASGIFVLDFDTKYDPGKDLNGVDVLDRWEELFGWPLPWTLTQRTASGGYHLVYALPDGVRVASRPRVAPSVDVKGEGGYVAVPSGLDPRTWLNPTDPVAEPSRDLLGWLRVARGHGNGGGGGGGDDGLGGGVLPPTDLFLSRGLGWFTGSRNRDAYRLAFRLWAQGHAEEVVAAFLLRAWDATVDQSDCNWGQLWRTAESARRRRDAAHDEETAAARVLLDKAGWSA